jgi:predicted hydrocarbon binding protein
MDNERKKIVKEEWNAETGEFFNQELPELIMGSVVFVGILKLTESIVGTDNAAVIFYEAGKKVGINRTKYYKGRWKLDGSALVRALEEFCGDLGWGTFNADLEALVIKVENSFIVKEYGESEVPICHFLRGCCAGMGEVLTNRALDCEERKCEACGDDCCEFVLSPVE